MCVWVSGRVDRKKQRRRERKEIGERRKGKQAKHDVVIWALSLCDSKRKKCVASERERGQLCTSRASLCVCTECIMLWKGSWRVQLCFFGCTKRTWKAVQRTREKMKRARASKTTEWADSSTTIDCLDWASAPSKETLSELERERSVKKPEKRRELKRKRIQQEKEREKWSQVKIVWERLCVCVSRRDCCYSYGCFLCLLIAVKVVELWWKWVKVRSSVCGIATSISLQLFQCIKRRQWKKA